MSLDLLPPELFNAVTSYLSKPDLCHLSRTCKRFDALTLPFLWKNIDLHGTGFHESINELEIPPSWIPLSKRARSTGGKPWELFGMLQHPFLSEDRRRHLLAQVETFCADINVPHSVTSWHLVPHLANLEALEVFADYWRHGRDESFISEMPAPGLVKLRFAKLFGYIPRPAARWVICASGAALERLELGMLDRPISSNLCPQGHRAFEPLPEEDLWLTLPHEERVDEDGVPFSPDFGSLYAAEPMSRPLFNFLPPESEHDDEQLKLPRLKHLYLCRPVEWRETAEDGHIFSASGNGDRLSSRADDGSLAEWRRILLAAERTLETLVLEERPGCRAIESDTWGSREKMSSDCLSGVTAKPLMDMVKGVVFPEDRGGAVPFPALKQVYMYGISVGTETTRPEPSFPGGGFMKKLEKRGVKCEARLGTWFQYDSDTGLADWDRWSSDDPSEDEDEDDDGPNEMRLLEWDSVMASV